MSLRRLLLTAAALLAAAIATPAAAAAQGTDVIRGRVIGPDSAAVAGATITVTSISGNVTRNARTDRDGRFTVTFPNGDGDYMVGVAALGFAARRFEIKRSADEEVLIADTKLSRVASVLDEVKVTAPRERVSRTDAQLPDVGGGEQAISQAALPAADLGDLAAMAASLPGVIGVPGQDGDPNGFSVLGLGADQNNTTLNGMAFGGSSMPRDAAVSSGLNTSPYDVSRGGFSGGQFSMRSRSGTNFRIRGANLNLDAPQMQWTDRAAQALGQQYSNFSLGGLLSGPIRMDKSFYSVAYQLGRRTNDFQSLLNTDATGLRAAGVAADSVDRFLGLLQDASVPTSVGGIGGDRLSDQAMLFANFDFAPPSSNSGTALGVTVDGSWNRQTPLSGIVTETPAFGSERSSWRTGLQARHSGYVKSLLTETTFGVSANGSETSPFLGLPAGRVQVNSQFDDGSNAVSSLAFGGGQGSNATQRNWTVGYLNQLSWFSLDSRHRVKLTSELRRDAVSQESRSNLLGTWSYASLPALESGEATSYSRQLAPRSREASQLVGALSLGDAWRPKQNVQVQYGVRLDGNRFLDLPTTNPEVEEAFGVRNDRVPSRFYVSPRVGFSWQYGTAPQIAGFEGAARGPRSVVRGGVGVFQNVPNTNLVGSALDNTGLASAVQQLSCVGDAVPVPRWDLYLQEPDSIPVECADGTTGSPFANRSPNVALFDEDYRSPRSLRSNLQWSGPVLANRFSFTADATWSRNEYQPGNYDLNFGGVERFALPDEGGRPVYVNPSSIVPSTGAIAARDGRLSDEFSRVTEMRSDLRSESRQLSLRLAPTRFSTKYSWNLSYVLSDVKEQSRGFASTAGDPREVEWTRGAFESRHQLVYNLGYNFLDAVRVNWYGSFRSGVPFTPLIAGDVNGDGYGNDRAFVFDPETATDPALASAMRSVLESGSDEARECLRGQVGRIAARNSCRGPWTSTATLSITLNPVKFRMPQRATLSFQLNNPLGAADMLINGSDDLKGWGQSATPDQALLYVRGFDPATNRYRYDVNRRFGATNPQQSAFRSPVTLTAMMRFDIGPTRERQLLTQQLDRGRRMPGTKTPEPMLRAMYSQGGITNPMATIIRQQDSLGLTAAQADSIATLNRWYMIRVDSIWAPVVREFGALEDRYDHDIAYDRYLRARQATVDLLAKLGPQVRDLLTPTQRRKLPPFVASHLDTRYLASIRSGTASYTGGGGMMTGPAGPGGVMAPAGSHVQTVIVRQ